MKQSDFGNPNASKEAAERMSQPGYSGGSIGMSLDEIPLGPPKPCILGRHLEKYRVYHHSKYKCRNRAEYLMIDYIKKFLAEPTHLTIEEIREWCVKTGITDMEKSKGRVTFSEIQVSSTVAGHDNWVTRQFAMYGAGRGTYTIGISETLMKDADNGYEVVDTPLNSGHQIFP